ncbi:hypothetical protein [Virgisporangium aurantiacum]|uniref:Uncharacterized protein n=1 Tax=Virgisporangium aurantiacum TaxID=175570 RepID=A0A8J3ZM12_9ACTN|nr:hypothetical protein [Virgisporangium aurantiacum]GIJ64470.1 hypothetical protein Vau01_119860 [Virgisporangium aurantiacum]
MASRQYRRARADLGSSARRRLDLLPPGALQHAVLDHLRAYPDTDFSVAELANALRRPNSRSAISTACRHWVATGHAVQTQRSTNRYQAAPAVTNDAVPE